MSDFKLTPEGDLDLSSGDIVIIDGQEALKQAVEVAYKTILGECVYDPALGVAVDIIFDPESTIEAKELHIRQVALGVQGIESWVVFEYSEDSSTRKGTVSGRLKTIRGEFDFSVDLPGGA